MRLVYKKILTTFVEANEKVTAYGQTDYSDADVSLATGWWLVRACAEAVIVKYKMPCHTGEETIKVLTSVGDTMSLMLANGIYTFTGLVLLSYQVGPSQLVEKTHYEQTSDLIVDDDGGGDIPDAEKSVVHSFFTGGIGGPVFGGDDF